jgi:hypothetical protein
MAGGFIARPLGHSIYTDTGTIAELNTNVRDAFACHLRRQSISTIQYTSAQEHQDFRSCDITSFQAIQKLFFKFHRIYVERISETLYHHVIYRAQKHRSIGLLG